MKNCDLCNKSISVSEMTVIPGKDFQQAVQGGFNPFTTPGIEMSNNITFSLSFPSWRQMVLNDTSNWGLCQNCARTFRSVIAGFEKQREIQSITPQNKKWFQIWK